MCPGLLAGLSVLSPPSPQPLLLSGYWACSASNAAFFMNVQMSVARAEHQEGTFRGPVVILADMDKSEMDEAVLKGLQGVNHLEVPASILCTSNQTRLLSCSTPCVHRQHHFACLPQLWSCLFTSQELADENQQLTDSLHQHQRALEPGPVCTHKELPACTTP